MKGIGFWLAVSAFSMGVAQAGEGAHWGYEGEASPEHWGELAPEFAACAKGANQSPVDIQGELKAAVPRLSVSYTSPAIEVINNGHSIQANFAPGSWMMLGDHRYELKQVHFHVPSENHIHGKEFAMEGHLVHQDKEGKLAVLAVMYKPGKAQDGIARIWKQMPENAGDKHAFEGTLLAKELLPKQHDYYYFSGSLTTPPCSEGVAWVVMKHPVNASMEQVERFAHAMHHPNNRPVQPLNSRLVID